MDRNYRRNCYVLHYKPKKQAVCLIHLIQNQIPNTKNQIPEPNTRTYSICYFFVCLLETDCKPNSALIFRFILQVLRNLSESGNEKLSRSFSFPLAQMTKMLCYPTKHFEVDDQNFCSNFQILTLKIKII